MTISCDGDGDDDEATFDSNTCTATFTEHACEVSGISGGSLSQDELDDLLAGLPAAGDPAQALLQCTLLHEIEHAQDPTLLCPTEESPSYVCSEVSAYADASSCAAGAFNSMCAGVTAEESGCQDLCQRAISNTIASSVTDCLCHGGSPYSCSTQCHTAVMNDQFSVPSGCDAYYNPTPSQLDDMCDTYISAYPQASPSPAP